MTDDILELFGYPAPRLLGPMLPVGSITTLAGVSTDLDALLNSRLALHRRVARRPAVPRDTSA
jgi:hypothetical protein